MNKRAALLATSLLLRTIQGATAASTDLAIADFEGADYGTWAVTGDAFGSHPARGTLPNQMPVTGYLGQGLANSFVNGDDATGTLTSPSLLIERPYIQFLIGGGKQPGKACINLLIDGRVTRSATGPNDKPGGSERLEWQEWDVREFAGKSAIIQIVDEAKGGWGHINVDQIIETDRRLPALVPNVQRKMDITKRYLNLPVKNGATKRQMSLSVDGGLARQFEIELADATADWWAFLDVGPFRRKEVVLEVDQLPEDSQALISIEQGDVIKGANDLYHEKLRPQFHFTSKRGWNNDPNGLVYYAGEYHLFYQHNPYGWNWGNMHWGHATSRDLVHWRELGEALYPDQLGTVFSGSAVVDWPNSAGFSNGRETAIVLMHTAAGGTSIQSKGEPFTQCTAYSADRGRSWTKYAGNPVLPHIAAENRDPKVIWHAPSNKWLMALYLDKNDYALFESKDLKQWQRLCDVAIPGTIECPEFFEIAVEGDRNNTRWIFYGGNGGYLVGRFDGSVFKPESGPHPLHFGNCFYASQTYNDLPRGDSRRILIGWGTVNLPGMPFNQMMTFPVELTLRTTEDGLRLFANPVREIGKLERRVWHLGPINVREGDNPLKRIQGELFDIEANITVGNAREIRFEIRGVPITYDVAGQELTCLDKKGHLRADNDRLRLRLLVDRASIEIYGGRGRLYMPMGIVLAPENRSLSLSVVGGSAKAEAIEVRVLKSAWDD